jgi:hypothetical protein
MSASHIVRSVNTDCVMIFKILYAKKHVWVDEIGIFTMVFYSTDTVSSTSLASVYTPNAYSALLK